LSLYSLRVLQLNTGNDLWAELEHIGTEPRLLRDQLDKGTFRVIKLERVPPRLARFLYQELVLEGGQVVLPARMDDHASEADVLLCGTRYQLQHLVIRLRTQSDDELAHFATEFEYALLQYDDHAPRETRTDIGADAIVLMSSRAAIDAALRDLRAQIERAIDAGIAPEKIVVGVDARYAEQLNRIGELRVFGRPVLLDVSHIESAEHIAALVALGIARGVDIVGGRDAAMIARIAQSVDDLVRKK
jgi:hypothetical protein